MRIRQLKVHYFLLYAVLGAMMPYLPLYCRQVGLSESQIGWVLGVYGLAVMVAPPIYTALADRWANNRRLIGSCYAIAAVAVAGMMFSGSFSPIVAMHLLFSLGFTAMIPLLDGLAFSVIREPADESDPAPGTRGPTPYRSIRVWGSLGWMAPGFGLALLIALKLDTMTVCLIALGACMSLAMIGWALVDGLPPRRTTDAPNPGSALPTAEALAIVMRPPVFAFMLGLGLLFLSSSMYYAFYPGYLDDLGVPTELLGLITNIGVIVEIGFMVGSGWLVKRLGVRWLMGLGAAAMALRLGLLAAVPNAWVAVATQVLHGPVVIAMYLIPPMYLDAKADERYRSSIQGIKALVVFGVARIVGTAAGGHLGEFGLHVTFWVAAGLSLAATIVLLAMFRDDSVVESTG